MQAIKNILSIIALCLIVWVLADALDIVGKVTQSITPAVETPTAPNMAAIEAIPPTSLPMPTAWTPEPTAPPTITVELVAQPAQPAPELTSDKARELAAIKAALPNLQRVASDCLDAWITANMAGKELPNCQPVLYQVQQLSIREYELEAGR